MKSFAVIRADDRSKLKTALADLERHGALSFIGVPKRLEPDFADRILLEVMQIDADNLKWMCKSAAIVPLHNSAGAAISALRKIHPPAHVIIVSNRYPIFNQLMSNVDTLPDLRDYRSPAISHKSLD